MCFFKAILLKFFGGESLFVNEFTNNTQETLRVTLVQGSPGDIRDVVRVRTTRVMGRGENRDRRLNRVERVQGDRQGGGGSGNVACQVGHRRGNRFGAVEAERDRRNRPGSVDQNCAGCRRR